MPPIEQQPQLLSEQDQLTGYQPAHPIRRHQDFIDHCDVLSGTKSDLTDTDNGGDDRSNGSEALAWNDDDDDDDDEDEDDGDDGNSCDHADRHSHDPAHADEQYLLNKSMKRSKTASTHQPPTKRKQHSRSTFLEFCKYFFWFCAIASIIVTLFIYFRKLQALVHKIMKYRIGGYFILFVSFMFQALLCLPTLPLVLAGGYTYGLQTGTIVITVCSVSTAAIAFLLSRYVMRDYCRRKLGIPPVVVDDDNGDNDDDDNTPNDLISPKPFHSSSQRSKRRAHLEMHQKIRLENHLSNTNTINGISPTKNTPTSDITAIYNQSPTQDGAEVTITNKNLFHPATGRSENDSPASINGTDFETDLEEDLCQINFNALNLVEDENEHIPMGPTSFPAHPVPSPLEFNDKFGTKHNIRDNGNSNLDDNPIISEEIIKPKDDGPNFLTKIDQVIADDGFTLVFLLRFSPLHPYGIFNYMFGVTSVPFVSYFFGSLVALLPTILMEVYMGSVLKNVGEIITVTKGRASLAAPGEYDSESLLPALPNFPNPFDDNDTTAGPGLTHLPSSPSGIETIDPDNIRNHIKNNAMPENEHQILKHERQQNLVFCGLIFTLLSALFLSLYVKAKLNEKLDLLQAKKQQSDQARIKVNSSNPIVPTTLAKRRGQQITGTITPRKRSKSSVNIINLGHLPTHAAGDAVIEIQEDVRPAVSKPKKITFVFRKPIHKRGR